MSKPHGVLVRPTGMVLDANKMCRSLSVDSDASSISCAVCSANLVFPRVAFSFCVGAGIMYYLVRSCCMIVFVFAPPITNTVLTAARHGALRPYATSIPCAIWPDGLSMSFCSRPPTQRDIRQDENPSPTRPAAGKTPLRSRMGCVEGFPMHCGSRSGSSRRSHSQSVGPAFPSG